MYTHDPRVVTHCNVHTDMIQLLYPALSRALDRPLSTLVSLVNFIPPSRLFRFTSQDCTRMTLTNPPSQGSMSSSFLFPRIFPVAYVHPSLSLFFCIVSVVSNNIIHEGGLTGKVYPAASHVVKFGLA